MADVVNDATNCQQLIDDSAYIIANPQLFDTSSVSIDTVKTEAINVASIMDSLATEVESIVSDPLSATKPKSFDFCSFTFPPLKPSPPPDLAVWVGVTGIAQYYGDSNSWLGIPGHTLDSFGVSNPGKRYDLHFSYAGKFLVMLSPTPEQTISSGDGGKAGPDGGRAWLLALTISIGGTDAYRFDVCYELQYSDGTSAKGTNGAWLGPTTGKLPECLKVYLQPKGVGPDTRFLFLNSNVLRASVRYSLMADYSKVNSRAV